MNLSAKKPVLLLAGGGKTDRTAMIDSMARAFAGIEKPQVAYIGCASGDNLIFFKMMEGYIKKAGAAKVVLVKLAKAKADVAAAKSALAACDAIFISGGEVEDGMNWLKKHDLVGFLHELYNGGKLFVGMSAGTIMLGAKWVKWRIPDDNDTAELFDCLNIVPETFDTHAEEEDWIEIKTALKLMGDGARGYGIPSGGVITGDGEGALTDVEKTRLTFVNSGGEIKLL